MRHLPQFMKPTMGWIVRQSTFGISLVPEIRGLAT